MKQKSDISKEKEIITRIQTGETGLFDQLILQYQKDVFKMVISIINHLEDAEDLTQESFARAYLNIKKFKFLSSFKTWLLAITFNLIKDYMHKKKYALPLNEEIMIRNNRISDIEERNSILGLISKIQEEVNNFSPMQKLIFQMRVQQEMNLKQIAEYLNLSEGTIKSHMNRIYTRLRKKYTGEFKEIFKESYHE